MEMAAHRPSYRGCFCKERPSVYVYPASAFRMTPTGMSCGFKWPQNSSETVAVCVAPCEMEKQRIDEQSPLFAHLPMMPSLYIQINQN
jgi:hypothetical protein